MKTWLIIGLLAMTTCYPAKEQQNTPSQHQQETKQTQQPLPLAPVATNPSYPYTEIKQCCCNDDTKGVLEKATSPDTWPNWVLVIAAFGAMWAAVRTLR